MLFGPGVQIYTATHPTDYKKRQKLLEYAKPIVIGDDCWLGGIYYGPLGYANLKGNSIVLPGVEIGKCSVVGAGSVVTKNVAPYSIVAGNPAKFLRWVDDSETERSKMNKTEN